VDAVIFKEPILGGGGSPRCGLGKASPVWSGQSSGRESETKCEISVQF